MRLAPTTTGLLTALVLGGLCGCNTGSHGKSSASTTAATTGEVDSGHGASGGTAADSLAIHGITPASGSAVGQTQVTLTGTGFTSGATVELGGTPATDVVVVSDTTLTAVTPAHLVGPVDVVVTLPDGSQARLNNAFTFDPHGSPLGRVVAQGDPSGAEQELLELANRARRDPAAEGQRLGTDFSAYKAMPPLSFNGKLGQAAVSHALDMAARGFFSHTNPDGQAPSDRIRAAGYDLDPALASRDPHDTEYICAAQPTALNTPQEAHDVLLAGHGQQQPKPEAILGGGDWSQNREIGIGYRTGLQSAQPWKNYVCEELATTSSDRPFVLGTVYADANGDGIANDGEGQAGVTVVLGHVSGFSITTQTATAGGYAFEVLVDGDYMVIIDGKPVAVTMKGDSVKVDLVGGQIATPPHAGRGGPQTTP